MNFTLIPSLKHIALVKVGILLWNEQDITDLASQNYAPTSGSRRWSDQFHEKEGNIIAKVNELPLPELLKEKLPSFIKPIGWQLWTWFHSSHVYSSVDVKGTVNFCWTLRGSLDAQRTAKRFLEEKDIDFDTCLQIAGIYCLEEDYYNLCKKNEELCKFNNIETSDRSFTLFVKSCLEKEFLPGQESLCTMYVRDTVTSNEYMFRCAAVTANEAATRYLLQKLTPEEKKKTLVKTARFAASVGSFYHVLEDRPVCHKSRFSNVVGFLMSVMSEEQQIEVLRKKYGNCKIIACFLEYPWQYLFLDMLERAWPFLETDSFLHILNSIGHKIKQSCDDYNYEYLFQIVWQRIPNAIKLKFLELPYYQMLLSILPGQRGVKNLLLLSDLLALNGEVVIFQNSGKNFCRSLIHYDQWDLFKSFILKCISSTDLMIRFKKELTIFSFFLRRTQPEFEIVSESQWEMSFDIINNCILSLNKKKMDSDVQSAKCLWTYTFDESTDFY